MNKKLLKIISWGTVMVIFIMMAGCVSSKKEKQKITVSVGKTKISLFNGERDFTSVMDSVNLEDLVYVKNDKNILIEFHEKKPQTVSLSEHILNEKGEPKFSTEEAGKNIDIKWNGSKASFKTEPNIVTLLSSNGNDYNPGATIKGYHLICGWGESNSEYFFVIKSDAVILNE